MYSTPVPRPPQAFIACSMKSGTASNKSLGRPGYEASTILHVVTAAMHVGPTMGLLRTNGGTTSPFRGALQPGMEAAQTETFLQVSQWSTRAGTNRPISVIM